MASRNNIFTTIRTEGALLPADLLQRISEGATLDGLTPESYHRSGEKLNEAINRSWNALQGVWASFRAAQERLPETDLGTSLTRERWLLPLFRELDYGRLQTAAAIEIDGRSYAISHGWEQVPIHLVSYKLDLDRRTPGAAGAATASPHSLLQVFLNRSENNLWGFLSNGCKLRILRDNASLTRQAYVEFDLEAMMDGEVYSDFVLLWLLCHQSRVEGERPSDCWLEKWMKVAEDQGTRALDQLRDGVEAAITALGLGFLEHPANAVLRDQLTSGDLSAQDYYRQLLRMVYRLLFLFVAEDRDLLLDPQAAPEARERYTLYYSTQRLRHIAERFKGTRHTDLFEGLRLIMGLLSGDANGAGAGLGLVPLGSFLFSDEAVAAVIDCQISNQRLLDAVRALALTYDQRAQAYRTVDYKNLGSDELGSIFESLLELHPQINIPARQFALATAAGNERKTTGSYYTPESLVHALLDSALNPVLEEAARKGEEAVLNLKACDPACGSGHFLIAAANRMAKVLAGLRTGEEEPAPAALQEARRDVISHCIYGVDINPMAVELCKVNLWMEALEPGKPLSFLDHRILVGNSLLGTTPKLMAGGIPDDAFNPIEGDDPKYVTSMKRVNREERKQREAGTHQMGLFDAAPAANYGYLTKAMHALDDTPDDTLDAVRRKEAQYAELANDHEYVKARLLADAWCAAFVWEKKQNGLPMPMTDLLYRRMEKDPLAENLQRVREYVVELKERYQFFHWHVAFPDVFTVPDDVKQAENEQTGWHGGFDCVLGNPPWERIKIQEKEWFAERAPEIAAAPNAAARKAMISALATGDPYLLEAFRADQRAAEGESHFVRNSGRYPLTGRGDVNTYPLFAEASRQLLNDHGRVGMIVPSGIATDDTTKFFFQDLMETRSLVSLFDFENRNGIFPGVHRSYKFCLLTVRAPHPLALGERGARDEGNGAEFVFFALSTADLTDREKRFTLSAEDIRLLNPNTGTTATFRSRRDAEITKAIYRRVPVLIREADSTAQSVSGAGIDNPWGISFLRMFDMSNDSGLFRTRERLEAVGGVLHGNRFLVPADDGAGERLYLPLYEAKLMHQFDHRWATYEPNGDTRDLTDIEKRDPKHIAIPRYWCDSQEVEARLGRPSSRWLISWRKIARSTDVRTFISGLFTVAGMGDSGIICIVGESNMARASCLYVGFSTFVLDYTVRQKLGGTNMAHFISQQLPVLPPHIYTPALLDFIAPRVLELTYTAWDLQPFAQDVGWQGAPFVWDDERRFLMRCELDALYFHLYQIARDDVDYIMETFPIVKRKDEAAHGEYRTRRIILEMYDQMAALPAMHVPAPKDASATYAVPDVRQWETWLNPPPADPSVAHQER